MKTRLLMILGSLFISSVLLYVFVMSTIGQCDLPLTHCTNFGESNLGGGSIDLDPDLSPSYALDFSMRLDSVFVVVPIMLSIISLLFVITHLLLKKKKVSSRPYLSLIASAIMLFFGIPSLINGLRIVVLLMQEERLHSLDFIANLTAMASVGFVLVLFGVIMLLKSKLIRSWLGMIR